MKSHLHTIGSPLSIVAFEASARHGSFTKAAKELNVSQPAISRQIKNLEERLGVRLFQRKGNVISLSAPGEKLYHAVHGGLTQISSAMEEIVESLSDTSVTLRSLSSVFTSFIFPAETQKFAESIGLSLVYHAAPSYEPPNHGTPTIVILYGDNVWRGYHQERILDDALIPVCAPDLVQGLVPDRHHELFEKLPVLQLSDYADDWMNWRTWSKREGFECLKDKPLQVFTDYETMIEACRSGQGIAIGSPFLVAPSIKSGTLVRLTDEVVWTRYGFDLVYDPILALDKRISKLVEFLKEAAAEKSRTFMADVGLSNGGGR